MDQGRLTLFYMNGSRKRGVYRADNYPQKCQEKKNNIKKKNIIQNTTKKSKIKQKKKEVKQVENYT